MSAGAILHSNLRSYVFIGAALKVLNPELRLDIFRDAVYARRNCRPWLNRFSAVIWNALYVDTPLSSKLLVIPTYCGKGRSACATLPEKPGYGDWIPAATACGELISASSVPPKDKYVGFNWFRFSSAEGMRSTLFPTYDGEITMPPGSSRCSP